MTEIGSLKLDSPPRSCYVHMSYGMFIVINSALGVTPRFPALASAELMFLIELLAAVISIANAMFSYRVTSRKSTDDKDWLQSSQRRTFRDDFPYGTGLSGIRHSESHKMCGIRSHLSLTWFLLTSRIVFPSRHRVEKSIKFSFLFLAMQQKIGQWKENLGPGERSDRERLLIEWM